MRERQRVQTMLKKEIAEFRRDSSNQNFLRLTRVDELKNQSLKAKIDRDNQKVQAMQKERSRLITLRSQAQHESEKEKREIMRQFESIKKRGGGKINPEDLQKLGIESPTQQPKMLNQTSCDLSQHDSTTVAAAPADVKEPQFKFQTEVEP